MTFTEVRGVSQVIPEDNKHLPVAVIGAGPIGLAAAAHLAERGLPFTVFEGGHEPGANILDWGHVRLFTPWKYLTDSAATRLLHAGDWVEPDPEELPTGAEFVRSYLHPLAEIPSIKANMKLGARVLAVSRIGVDKVKTRTRDRAPFLLRVQDTYGTETDHEASAVIDASGTWGTPNPLGASGIPAMGEAKLGKRLRSGIPDVLGDDRDTYSDKVTLVVGSGHSAANAALDLLRLAEDSERTSVVWAVRGSNLSRAFGGGDADELPARGQVGLRLRAAVETGRLEVLTDFSVGSVGVTPEDRVHVRSLNGQEVTIDNIIAATGQRPDLGMLRELRLDLDPWLESPRQLAPVIDPNLHHCGSVPPHGFDVLSHPESGFFIAGVKSYGRAPTFLMMTGYEQVRSITAAMDGDFTAARELRLKLPETGVCVVDFEDEPVASSTNLATTSVQPTTVTEVPAGQNQSSCCG